MNDKKLIYRSIGQTDGLTITAETKHAVTEAEAISTAEKNVFVNEYRYKLKPFVTVPICTETQWKYGNINFCPRCGKNINEFINDDPEYAVDQQDFECPECEADISVSITTPAQLPSWTIGDQSTE